jgi:hypothetical protein
LFDYRASGGSEAGKRGKNGNKEINATISFEEY